MSGDGMTNAKQTAAGETHQSADPEIHFTAPIDRFCMSEGLLFVLFLFLFIFSVIAPPPQSRSFFRSGVRPSVQLCAHLSLESAHAAPSWRHSRRDGAQGS